MKILFHVPHLNTVYAARTIHAGFKNAFEDLGHSFKYLSCNDNQAALFDEYEPDLFFTSLHSYNLKHLDLRALGNRKRHGLKVVVSMPHWRSPISRLRINEAHDLHKNNVYINLIKSGNYGDIYRSVCEQGDPRMDGFEKATNYKYHTIPLAADKLMHYPEYSECFRADISYVGTYLSEKRKFIKEGVFPLRNKYDVKLYGQDWTFVDRLKGFGQKAGQYFNLPYLRSMQKPKLNLEDERRIYAASIISINIHEEYQKQYGGDCNERTFKIPLCGGFEITDDVACIRKYFKDGEEIVIAKDKKDWLEKIEYYIRNPDKRLPIIAAGRKRVLAEHTYHNRVTQILEICRTMR